MYKIQQTDVFANWLDKLRNVQAKVAILRRLDRVRRGNLGDVKFLGSQVSEMHFDIGPGYRLYFTVRGGVLILLLCGGDKSSQIRDIEWAKKLAGEC